MKSNLYTAIIKKAAQEYFREKGTELAWLNNRQHRMLVDAVHETYSRIAGERERRLIEAIYKDVERKFVDAVPFHAAACGIGERKAWAMIDRFAQGVMERAGFTNNGSAKTK